MNVDKNPLVLQEGTAMFGYAKQSVVKGLQAEVASLREQINAQTRGHVTAIKMIEFLLPELEKVIGAKATTTTLEGTLKVASVGNVEVKIDGFNRKAYLSVRGPRAQAIEPITLQFNLEGQLDSRKMREFQGFLAEIDNPVEAGPFWSGVKRTAA